MNRGRRVGRIGGLVACGVAAAPFALLWVLQVTSARAPLTARARLDLGIWMAVFATPAVVAAWLLWRAGWRQAHTRLGTLDGPGWLLAAAVATLPAGRGEWGQAMAAELAQVPDRPARWRFALGCARAAVLPPEASRGAVAVVGVVAVGAVGGWRWGRGWCWRRGGCSGWGSWGCWVGWPRWPWPAPAGPTHRRRGPAGAGRGRWWPGWRWWGGRLPGGHRLLPGRAPLL
jgi:hypothetical protein